MENKNKVLVEMVVGLIIGFLAMPLSGWVITKLWGWFLVPLGLAQIELWNAVGLKVILNYFTNHYDGVKTYTLKERITVPIFMPLCALSVGWVVTLFM